MLCETKKQVQYNCKFAPFLKHVADKNLNQVYIFQKNNQISQFQDLIQHVLFVLLSMSYGFNIKKKNYSVFI